VLIFNTHQIIKKEKINFFFHKTAIEGVFLVTATIAFVSFERDLSMNTVL